MNAVGLGIGDGPAHLHSMVGPTESTHDSARRYSEGWRFVCVGAAFAAACTPDTNAVPGSGLGSPFGGTSTTSDDDIDTGQVDASADDSDSDPADGDDVTFDLMPTLPQPSGCSADLRDVLDETGAVVATCDADQGCLDGACVPACDAVEAAGSSLGCAYQIPTPPVRDTFLAPCHAVFVANSWVQPATVELQRDGVSYDVTTFGRIAEAGVDPSAWSPIPDAGIPVGEVAVLFVSGHPDAAHPSTGAAVTCPVTPAIDEGIALPGSGRGAASSLLSDTPLTVYDIIPFGGALSFIPSATLLFPENAWGENYVVLAPPVGTFTPAGPLWMQIVETARASACRDTPPGSVRSRFNPRSASSCANRGSRPGAHATKRSSIWV